jgi:amino acid transporter
MQQLRRGVGTLSLVFILFFCTSGGPYTTETLIHSVGPGLGLLILVLVPLLWSTPEVLIVGELASMLPEEGGLLPLGRSGLRPLLGISKWMAHLDVLTSGYGNLSGAV